MNGKDSSAFACGICSGMEASGNYEAREMMFGLRARFHYTQCAACGTLWLTDPPVDYSLYYPSDYHSFANRNGGTNGWIKDYLRAKRDGAYFGGGLIGRFLARRYGDNALLFVSRLNVGQDERILDVGCGSGNLLRRLAGAGFKNLVGVDPFLREDISNGNNIRVRKCKLEDLGGEEYDVVMFHHSLEHVADPATTLRVAAGLMAPGGRCLVRLPVVAHAWEKYGTNWVELDPPRHLWVPTEKAMTALAESAGLRVERVEYDSTDFQFWGSELYLRDVPLKDIDGLRTYFCRREIKEFQRNAAELNRQREGDAAAFFLACQGVRRR